MPAAARSTPIRSASNGGHGATTRPRAAHYADAIVFETGSGQGKGMNRVIFLEPLGPDHHV